MAANQLQLVHEIHAGEVYEYYPLGQYVVAAPAVCGGRPTFKYTRLEVGVILSLLASGISIQDILEEYELSRLTSDSIKEAARLASAALAQAASARRPITA
jgi:uncharacterized protein (DUF433 family)